MKSLLRVKIPESPTAFQAADSICFLYSVFMQRPGNDAVVSHLGCCYGTRGEQKSGGVEWELEWGCFWGMRPPPPPGRNWGGIITKPEEDWWRVESSEGGNIMVAAGKTEACRRHKIHPIVYIRGFKAQFSQLWRVFQRQSPVEVRPVSILFFCTQVRCVTFGFSLNDGWM